MAYTYKVRGRNPSLSRPAGAFIYRVEFLSIGTDDDPTLVLDSLPAGTFIYDGAITVLQAANTGTSLTAALSIGGTTLFTGVSLKATNICTSFTAANIGTINSQTLFPATSPTDMTLDLTGTGSTTVLPIFDIYMLLGRVNLDAL